ncbi:E3 ubiquitin-protein ligase TRIM39-like isoform X3 [Hemicordylus capensis]|nr:E3 ubiquitin-protein ligase TRIM39-like isoform X3 [Hemicordylus capensis]XP_053147099.1 E3 ubiquitin-protein ligase TRIM39-like isoform X3 [Hemicordylus capensis]XP_053147101.1 E3 ubiquitin-protein ligase TRIM39-like isoform X3 [Hemicordylus capensis]XP_053147102.1 E3 ubiquitin-protein ligase TRIM39-like isoform X3 [Hemicordylus capensis]XP_053147103.1 E3 ubiquitin-protein ligase TRIM39-like isoform X3 [Hemicordylus capensis]
MATTNPLENLQVEASCSVCLEYLKDPVIIDCGHNFCRVCITRWWEELNRDFPCPVCRKTFRHRTLKPNRQLGNMVEIAKQLQVTNKRKVRDENLCEKHNEVLRLFCKEDQEAVCLVCEISHEHRSHTVVSLDDASLEYKEKLQKCLEPLEQKLQDIAHCKSQEEKKPGELKRKVENRRQLIISEFEELHQFLEEEQQVLLRRLEDEEKEILQKLKDNVAELSEQRVSLNSLITEIEEKCLQSGIEMLKDVKNTLERCEELQAKEPSLIPIELEKNFCNFPRQYFVLRKIIKRLTGCSSQGDLTLDPETAHPNLVLSEDRKSVKFVEQRLRDLPESPRRFTVYPCVLATKGFTSGRHYWEVEVGEKTHWALGVCNDSVSRKGETTSLPETGYWRVRLFNGDKYAATTTPFTPINVTIKPKRVGVFLDYEAGKLSFYNVTDRSHIYTFTDTFSEKLWPFFYPGIRAGRKNAAPLIIRPSTDWE